MSTTSRPSPPGTASNSEDHGCGNLVSRSPLDRPATIRRHRATANSAPLKVPQEISLSVCRLTPQAVERHIDALRPALLNRVRRTFPADDAEDIVQEACVKAIQYQARFRHDTGLEGLTRWLHLLLQQAASDYREGKEGPRPHQPLTVLESEPPRQEATDRLALRQALRDQLAQLRFPALQRRCLTLWLDGYTTREIAGRVGRSQTYVVGKINHGRKRLRASGDIDVTRYTLTLFQECAQVTIYRKPHGVWKH